MKHSILFSFLALIIVNVSAQLPGKKFKTPYQCFDGHKYIIGEVVKIGVPSKGKMFEQITTYNKTSFLETVSAVTNVANSVMSSASGQVSATPSRTSDNNKPFEVVDNAFSNQEATIQYFSFYEQKNDPKNNSTFVVAKMKSNPEVVVAFNMELAIKNGEMYSNNPDFQKAKNQDISINSDTTLITQFSSKIHTKFLNAVGSIDKQTVTLNFLLTHVSVHQMIRMNASENSSYDMEGNEFKSSNLSIGSVVGTYSAINKIPTGVPVKVSVTFNKILPNVKLLRYVTVKVYYEDAADGGYPTTNEGVLEIKNLKINWL